MTGVATHSAIAIDRGRRFNATLFFWAVALLMARGAPQKVLHWAEDTWWAY